MTKREKILLLMQTANTKASTFAAFKQKIETMSMFDEASKERFSKVFNEAMDEYDDMQVKIYEKWLSEAAVDASIAFYASPVGQEVTNNMPHITQELVNASMGLTKKVFDQLIAEEGLNNPDFGFGNFDDYG